MIRVLRCFFIGALSLLLTSSAAPAQGTAALNGRVTDESGAVLPGVTVTATQTDTAFTRTTVTDGSGLYVMPNLPTGPYRLEVSLQGFRTHVQTGIVLQVAATPTINAVLAVGSLEESVTVEAAAPLVDVRSAGIGDVVENERIVELPLQGRQVTDLIVLAGAAVQTGGANTRAMQGGVAVSVAGGQSFAVAYLLDGAMHNDPQNNLNLPLPFPDALQEFSVATGGLAAENGMHSGATVNAVTRSGTNNFQGNLFEFIRDRRFNATQVFAAAGPDGKRRDDGLLRNQFGGTLGGPIARDKLFFFGGYQGTAVRQQPASFVARVPTAAMLAGDFTSLASPACNGGRQITLRAPFANNRIDPARFSPAALQLAARLPSSTDPCGEVTYARTADSDERQAVGRLDYQWSGDHSLFARYMATFYEQPSPYAQSDNVLTTTVPGLDNLAQSAAFGSTRVFGSDTVNSLRVVVNRTAINRGNPPFFEPRDLGAKLYSYMPGQMIVSVTGGFNISSGMAANGRFITNATQVNDDLTVVRGNHQIGLGASLSYWKMHFQTTGRAGGNWFFTGEATGLGMADLLTGRVNQVEHGAPGDLPMDQWHVGVYAQDTWRATTRITVNTGLRWEPYFGQRILSGAVTNFSMDNFRNNVRSTVYHNAPAGLLYNGDPGFPTGRRGHHPQWWNLLPRVGVAWDVTGDGRMAIRSSYGLSYDFPSAEYQNVSVQAAPFSNGNLVQTPPGGMDDPYGHFGGDPHPIATSPDTKFQPFSPFAVLDPDINSPRVQSWNVTIERQIGTGWAASASYLGSYTDRLWGQVQLNPSVFLGLGPCTLQGVFYPVCSTTANLHERRVFSLSGENPASAALYGDVALHTDLGTADYRGLKLSFRRRAASGVSLNGNYTWSRCFGLEGTNSFAGNNAGYTDPSNPDFDRGYCDHDRTHVASFTVGAQTPQFGQAVLRAVASGWRASGILLARSGSRLNILTGRDTAFNGVAAQRVNQVSDDVYGEKTIARFLNPAAFAQPAPGTFGNYVRNSIVGPGFWTIDFALSRLVSLGVGQSLEFRVESFNLLNNFNWGNPGTNFGAGTFGRIQSQAGTPRIMQFGIKYGF